MKKEAINPVQNHDAHTLTTKFKLEMELRKQDLLNKYRLMFALLGATVLLNLAPAGLALVGRRLPDNVVNPLAQAGLILLGNSGSATAILLGSGNTEKNARDSEQDKDRNGIPDHKEDGII